MQANHKTKKSFFLIGIVSLITLILIVLSGLTFFQSTNWLVELFANFQLQYTLLFLGLVLVWIGLKRPLWVVLTTFCFIFNFLTILPFYFQPTAGAALPTNPLNKISILFSNFNFKNTQFNKIVDLTRDNQPDILAMVEVPKKNFEAIAQLLPEYTQTYQVQSREDLGLALFIKPTLKAKFQTKTLTDLEKYPLVIAQIEQNNGQQTTLFLIHPPPPITAQNSKIRNQTLASLAQMVSQISGPVIVVGDFNATSWSAVFRQMLETSKLTDSRLNFGVQPSWPSFLPKGMRIPIDHVLVKNLTVIDRKIVSDVGSDHLPVLLEFTNNQEGQE